MLLIEFNLIGGNGKGSFPRRVKAEIYSNLPDPLREEPASFILGRIVELTEEHGLEIRLAQERFGDEVLAVVKGRGYRFKRLETNGCFELEKNWL